MLEALKKRVPNYATITTATKSINVDGVTYSKPPVTSDTAEYRSEETMDELIANILRVKNASPSNASTALKELNAFLDEFKVVMEVVELN